ncbi:hypothetical protein lerEdw1_019921 [Lerista edwardsae]|nr:hypothetical protein lerEdw1_019921 [Lerista edwardsae]
MARGNFLLALPARAGGQGSHAWKQKGSAACLRSIGSSSWPGRDGRAQLSGSGRLGAQPPCAGRGFLPGERLFPRLPKEHGLFPGRERCWAPLLLPQRASFAVAPMPHSLPSMSSDFQHYSFRMPNIGFQNLPLNIYIVVFGTAIFVFILSLLFCCYLIRLRHQAHKELYAYKQVILKEKVKELNLHEGSRLPSSKREFSAAYGSVRLGRAGRGALPGPVARVHVVPVLMFFSFFLLPVFQICAVCLEEFKPKDELGICPCKHAFHRKCLIKWLEVRKVCPLCNMPVLQLAQLHSKQDPHGLPREPLPGAANLV